MGKIEHTPRTAENEGSRLEFETLISDLSSSFINLPPGEVDGEIEDALRRVCELLGIDLAVLWQWSAVTPDVIAPTHAYPGLEGLQSIEPLSQEQFPWIRQEIVAGRVVALSSLEEFPAEADVDREFCRLYGVISHLSLPLSVGGEPPVGLIGLNTLQAERDWPDALVKRLQLVAQVFTNALARKRTDEALRASEERLALAADSAGAGLWILDYRTGVFWVTDKARAIFGYSPDEVIDMTRLEASVHPDDRDLVRGVIERSARIGEAVTVEYRILPGDGSERWILSRGRPRSASIGESDRLMGVSIDITERKRAQEALHESEARLTSGAELAGLGFYEVDFSTGAMYADDRLRDLCGVPPGRDQGLQVLEFWMEHLHPDDLPHVSDLRQQLHEGRRERFSFEYRYLHPDRGETWIQHLAGAAARDATGRALRTYGVLRDVTERKRAEDELHDLSQRLIGAHEDERALLARELHDDVSQRLAVLAIDIGRAELAAPQGAQAEAMREVRAGLVRLSEDVHSLAYQLHPSILEELGLDEALRAECERRERQGRLDLTLDLEPLTGVVGKDAALCLFRVAQEALNNVAHHAGVRAATVTLRQMDGGLLLGVSDGGAGFDAGHPGEGMHLGLASMRERVRLVHGTLDIESAPGHGTTILAWVPAEAAS
ncbi:MAG: PAS domain-containing protein [Actinobacteria bacterium]|nr:PAS domain-containing protein [Actinomycetota bacterium]